MEDGYQTLDEALEKRGSRTELRVWAKEISKGPRRYYLLEKDKFYELYINMPLRDRKFHEIVLPDEPVNGYVDWDVDYSKSNRSRLQIIEDFYVFVTAFCDMARMSKMVEDQRDVKIRIYCASCETKFSKHVVFIIDGGKVMFQDNEECFDFMTKVWNSCGCPFGFDQNPYKSNQPFRLVGSTKFGETRQFVPAHDFTFPQSPESWDTKSLTIEDFYDSLLTHQHDPMVKLVSGSPDINMNIPRKKLRRSNHGSGSVRKGVIVPEQIKNICPILVSSWIDPACPVDKRRSPKTSVFHYDPVNSILEFGSNSKYCVLFGGSHDGNKVFFRANLERKTFVQKCHHRGDSCGTVDPFNPRKWIYRSSKEFQFSSEASRMLDDFRNQSDAILTAFITLVSQQNSSV